MIITPNLLAYLVLFGWPLIAIYLFSTKEFGQAVIRIFKSCPPVEFQLRL